MLNSISGGSADGSEEKCNLTEESGKEWDPTPGEWYYFYED